MPKICRFLKIRHALPISKVRIPAPIVLAQCKGHERRGEARKAIWCASSIVLEIAYSFSCTGRKWKYFQYKAQTYYRKKIMSSATVPAQYPSRLAIFWTHLSFRCTLPLRENHGAMQVLL
jgi:hypothetical protein